MLRTETTLDEECRELCEGLLECLSGRPDATEKATCAYLLDHLKQYYCPREAPPTLAA